LGRSSFRGQRQAAAREGEDVDVDGGVSLGHMYTRTREINVAACWRFEMQGEAFIITYHGTAAYIRSHDNTTQKVTSNGADLLLSVPAVRIHGCQRRQRLSERGIYVGICARVIHAAPNFLFYCFWDRMFRAHHKIAKVPSRENAVNTFISWCRVCLSEPRFASR